MECLPSVTVTRTITISGPPPFGFELSHAQGKPGFPSGQYVNCRACCRLNNDFFFPV